MTWRRSVSAFAIAIHLLAIGWPCEPARAATLVGMPSSASVGELDASHAHGHAGDSSGPIEDASPAAAHAHHHTGVAPPPAPPATPDTDLDFERVCPCGCGGGVADRGAPGARLGTAVLAAGSERAPARPRPALAARQPSAPAAPAYPLDPVPI